MYITVKEATKRIKDATTGLIDSPHIAIIMLTGAGRSAINNVLSHYHDMTKILTTTTRPKREGEISGKDYNFCTPEQYSSLSIIEGTEYEIGGNKYGLSIDDVIKKLSSGKKCLFSVNSRGALAMKRILGEDLFVAYVEVETITWLNKLHKGKTEREFLDRRVFGESELSYIGSEHFVRQTIDSTFYYRKPKPLSAKQKEEDPQLELKHSLLYSDNAKQMSELIYNAALLSKKEPVTV